MYNHWCMLLFHLLVSLFFLFVPRFLMIRAFECKNGRWITRAKLFNIQLVKLHIYLFVSFIGCGAGSWYWWPEDNIQCHKASFGRSVLSLSVSILNLFSVLILVASSLTVLYIHYRSQKFEDPAEGEDALVAKFKKLYDDLTAGFRNLEDEARWTVVDFV
jgi:hypothetical protein